MGRDRDLVKFNKSKCEAWQRNPMPPEGLGPGWHVVKAGGHGGQQVELLSQQCAPTVERASSHMGLY